MYARSARSALYACVGTTAIARPKRFAMFLKTRLQHTVRLVDGNGGVNVDFITIR